MPRPRSAQPELTAQLETLCLRALAEEYDHLNYSLFGGTLVRPNLCFSDATTRLGLWEAAPPSISLSRRLLLDRGWGVLVEVLKHEMAHQFVAQVLRADEPPHGPTFAKVCRERAIDSRAAGEVQADPRASHSILSKVAGLLALADSGNKHEAEAAMSAAQRLMLKYNLEQLSAAEAKGYRSLHLGTPTGRVEESARALAAILHEFFFVEVLWVSQWRPFEARWGSVLEVCGTAENIELAQYVHGFLSQTAERLWREHQRQHAIHGDRDRRKYIAGVMSGFYAKLKRERGQNQAQGLVWLGDANLKAFFRRRYPRTRSTSYATSGANSAYSAGRKAGENIVLHKGVGKGASGAVRLLKS